MFVREIEWRDPYDAFAPLTARAHAHLLHGGDLAPHAEWSVIAAFPVEVIEGAGGDDPFAALEGAMAARRRERPAAWRHLPFVSGALGFLGYESARHIEPSLHLPPSPFALPDASLGVYDASALFSRARGQAFVAGVSEAACDRLEAALGRAGAATPPSAQRFGAVASNFDRMRYGGAVAEVVENILDGDYYQANIAQHLTARADEAIDAFNLFRTLAAKSDAFHGALLQFDGAAVISNSPERFFRIEPGNTRRIVAEPIKGTRPRGHTPQEDRALAEALRADPKDRAENIMIADLLRNDLSRICRDGTVREEAVCALMTLAGVHHLVSRISGVLRDDAGLGEIFAALFPCGSITGAPKIEAMNAIARIEKIGRGPYCGAIGYVDDSGAVDFAVAIRTLIAEGKTLTIPVGGGVTLRSDPLDEYQETIVKARSALAAIGKTAEGL